jgi:mono/diheme cytochrome c family protein
MKKLLKWTGIVTGSLVVLAVVVIGILMIRTSRLLNQTYDVPVEVAFDEPDSATIEHGRQLVESFGCMGCHGEQLQGTVFGDSWLLFSAGGENLTRGEGGIGASYSDEDWVRAIRHGVAPDGRGLIIMPSFWFATLGRPDIEGIVAYLKSVEPVDSEIPEAHIGPFGSVLFTMAPLDGDFPLFSARAIDHSQPMVEPPPEGVNVEYGTYLARRCVGCHGDDLIGRDFDDVVSANLTALGKWSEDEFVHAAREGIVPDGRELSAAMPRWRFMTDDELSAVWSYLKTVPEVPTPELDSLRVAYIESGADSAVAERPERTATELLGATTTVAGNVLFEGDPPEMRRLPVDPVCGARATGVPHSEEVVVGDAGGLANVFVYVSAGIDEDFPAPSEPEVLDQRGCVYAPHVVGVQTGQYLEFHNSDLTMHNLHTRPRLSRPMNRGQVRGSGPIRTRFVEPEVMIEVTCDVHGWMTAYVGVVDHPYFAVTRSDGTFNFPARLPPGTYTISAWHERYGTSDQEVVITEETELSVAFAFSEEVAGF